MSEFPTLAIVIVSYDSAADLPECLKTLLENCEAYPAQTQVAVVENGDKAAQQRTHNTIKPFLKSNLKWLPAPENLGYGGGANYGWEHLEGELYIVLNPDMSFPVGWLQKFVAPFDKNPEIGIAGCKLLTRDGKIQHAGGLIIHGSLLGIHFGYREEDDGRWDESVAVDFVTGAALAVRREIVQALGGFDPAFHPGYFEDVDLCLRARKLGWKIWYEASAVAWHYEGTSFGRKSSYYELLHRNRLHLARKHLDTHQFFTEFIASESKRIAITPPSLDLSASIKIYQALAHSWQVKDNKDEIIVDDQNPVLERLPSRLSDVKKGWLVEEKSFSSRLPFVAKFRERFNNISTRWYVKPILQQQVDYNATVARAIEDLGQVVLAHETTQNIALAAIAERFTGVEERLNRIEEMLAKLVNEKKS
ncbi:MAG: glycosyltransferase family 2 protein [Chloroflexi bacterium]|uniref:Glycosyltransferase family 2 protein n=1 Tax=Candidatus Chlorohelix allophototropha TaxID=3003348 RepID=A0A8T7LVP0_9CHLR|nr:glycosyltransferase family 2 protein [Chloroflexota bacterium]WJW66834.1 glycosyltransferase family 2 protein [Chloroflexota bacterium L227-S17]